MQESRLLRGSSVQEKIPVPSPLCVLPVHCGGVRQLHRDVRPCTEATACTGAACLGLPVLLALPRHLASSSPQGRHSLSLGSLGFSPAHELAEGRAVKSRRHRGSL